MRTVNSYGETKEIKHHGGNSNLENQCNEIGCQLKNDFRDNPDIITKLPKDIPKRNVLNWKDIAGLWIFEEDW